MPRGKLLTLDEKNFIGEMFDLGHSFSDIATRMNISTAGARLAVMSTGRSYAKRKLEKFNTSFFDEESEERDYFIGFLMADGCNQGSRVTIYLNSRDQHILERMRDRVCPDQKLYFAKQKSSNVTALSINCREIVQKLEGFGITQRKSHTAKVIGLENSRHFWRGLMDGDGTVSFRKERYGDSYRYYPSLSILGSRDIMDQFSEYCRMITGRGSNPIERSGCWRCKLTCRRAAVMITNLYKNSTVHLHRKMDSASKIIHWYE